MLKCTVTTLPFATPSTVRGPMEILDTLIGPTTGPCPYGINISMLEGDIVASIRSKSTSRNFYAEGIQLRTRACLAKRQPCQSAIKVAAHGDEPRRPILLCGNCPGAHAQEKRQKVNSHGFLQVTPRITTAPLSGLHR